MVIRSKGSNESIRSSIPWCALKDERIVALQSFNLLQQLVERSLARAGVRCQPAQVVNYLTSQIAMVAAGEGIAIVPSFALAECQKRGLLTSRLTNPVVHLDLCQIRKGPKSSRRLLKSSRPSCRPISLVGRDGRGFFSAATINRCIRRLALVPSTISHVPQIFWLRVLPGT
jgi:hypothetical protein